METISDLDNLSVDEIASGLRKTNEGLLCVVCGESFERGVIYRAGEALLDAPRAAANHVQASHGGMLHVVSQLPKERSGLTDVQRSLIESLAGRTE